MAIKSSPLLGFHHILSQISFCLVVKFLFFKFHGPKLLNEALCFLDRGCQLLFVEYIHVLSRQQIYIQSKVDQPIIPSKSTYYSNGIEREFTFWHSWNPTYATVGAPTGPWVNLHYWHSWNPTVKQSLTDHSLTFDSRSQDESLSSSESVDECYRGGARTQHVQCGIAALATTFLRSWPLISVTKRWGY